MPSCGRCTKAGKAANCLYIDDPIDTSMRPDDAAAAANAEFSRGPLAGHYTRPIQAQTEPLETLSRLEYQDRRIKQLEAALNQSLAPPAAQHLRLSRLPLTPDSVAAVEPTGAPANVTDRETMLLRGKSFKTQFNGMTHPGSLIGCIPELNNLTKETFEQFPALRRVRQDMKALEDKTEYADSKRRLTPTADMVAMLPSRVETDQLVQLYLDNYDCIYHILHVPSFRQEYSEMWYGVQNARPHFVAVVLLLCATSRCLMPTEPWLYTANSSTAREKALNAISMCEQWLTTRSQKQVTIRDFQIRFLLNLAKLVNAYKFKRTWTDAGTMIRFFMAAGLHRNPDFLRKHTSALDKEMRRRLWAAATEFELQASFDRGMVSSSWRQQSDCPSPSNTDDEDVEGSDGEPAGPRPLSVFTNASYLAFASETFNLRYSLNTLLNNIRQTISFDDAKRYTEEVEACLASIPDWIGASSEAPRALLAITLRQYLLVLHDRQFRQTTSPSERNFSKMLLIDNASKITTAHKTLLNKGCRALQLLCHDHMRLALSVCHITTTPPDPQADRILTEVVEQNAAQVINDAIELVSDKVVRYGREQRQLWIILAANSFIKSKKDPSQKLLHMQEAVDKIVRLVCKIMACQKDAPTANGASATNESAEMPNGFIEYLPPVNANQEKVGNGEGVVDADDPSLGFDFDELAAWTFEDWSFNAGELLGFDGTV
ncbi:hypothetical protein LTR37_019940 [Vermiconidia calcicola]|uniref:Uncharacterized protein n=1 Tax=Vermiconidia calcicola TaxID=1690605 RepID=A0ACC3MCL7_9PEZI|nr:hypothetical protein LTR37_019940 [Vermiconidia calcicola]